MVLRFLKFYFSQGCNILVNFLRITWFWAMLSRNGTMDGVTAKLHKRWSIAKARYIQVHAVKCARNDQRGRIIWQRRVLLPFFFFSRCYLSRLQLSRTVKHEDMASIFQRFNSQFLARSCVPHLFQLQRRKERIILHHYLISLFSFRSLDARVVKKIDIKSNRSSKSDLYLIYIW